MRTDEKNWVYYNAAGRHASVCIIPLLSRSRVCIHHTTLLILNAVKVSILERLQSWKLQSAAWSIDSGKRENERKMIEMISTLVPIGVDTQRPRTARVSPVRFQVVVVLWKDEKVPPPYLQGQDEDGVRKGLLTRGKRS